jgi:hypothetical protein
MLLPACPRTSPPLRLAGAQVLKKNSSQETARGTCTNGAAQAGTGARPACGAMRRERVRRAAFVLPFSFVTFLLGKQEKSNRTF